MRPSPCNEKRTHDEERKLVVAAMQSPASLELTDGELRVTLAPQNTAHRSKAIVALCARLNDMDSATNRKFAGEQGPQWRTAA